MKSDMYLKAVLTVIAVALVVLVLQAVQPAFSQEEKFRVPSPKEIAGAIVSEIKRELCGQKYENPCYVAVVKTY